MSVEEGYYDESFVIKQPTELLTNEKVKKGAMELYDLQEDELELLRSGRIESEGTIIRDLCDRYLQSIYNEKAVYYLVDFDERHNDFYITVIYKESK